MKKTTNKKSSDTSTGNLVALGAGVVALATAGYFLLGPDGKKNIKKIKGWTLKAKGEVLEKIEKAKEISEPTYYKIVDTVMKKYLSAENKKEAEMLAKDLKKHWKTIIKNTKS
ncbi:MAG: hypothetical protein K9L98_03620 [Candidatus Pacebacteria bacterium]|nr:hypothetical protein [Candidatus Paceibacterota bacterium]MCF7863066.1 hypothetical protein [Candidatus Paceibacterota bacterium]